jgi:hypothetical protein
MPYTVKKVKGGFKACKKGGKKCFSKKPLTKKQAVKQIGAIASSEKREKAKKKKKKGVKKESFDQMINSYLNQYIFEDAMGGTNSSPSQEEIKKLTTNLQNKKKKELAAASNPTIVAKAAQALKNAGASLDSLE